MQSYKGENSMVCSRNYKQLIILQYKVCNREWQGVGVQMGSPRGEFEAMLKTSDFILQAEWKHGTFGSGRTRSDADFGKVL